MDEMYECVNPIMILVIGTGVAAALWFVFVGFPKLGEMITIQGLV